MSIALGQLFSGLPCRGLEPAVARTVRSDCRSIAKSKNGRASGSRCPARRWPIGSCLPPMNGWTRCIRSSTGVYSWRTYFRRTKPPSKCFTKRGDPHSEILHVVVSDGAGCRRSHGIVRV